jgi:hypothetical protein
MKMRTEIKYPVTITIACSLLGKGKLRITKQVDDEYSAIVEVAIAAVQGDALAGRACDALIDAKLVKGPRQAELFRDEPEGDGEPYEQFQEESEKEPELVEEESQTATKKRAPRRGKK